MREGLLGQFVAAVDAVHDLQRPVRLQLLAPGLHPAHEGGRLLGVAQPDEPVQGERCVADPRVPVVPVPRPAHRLGQPEGGRGHDGAVGPRGQELEGERRPVHHLSPAPPIGGARDPASPEVDGLLEGLGDEVGIGGRRLLAGLHALEDERRGLVGAQGELGHRRAVLEAHGHGGAEPQGQRVPTGRDEERPVGRALDRVSGARVVEPGLTDHPEADLPAHGLDATDDVVLVLRLGDGHVVGDFGHPGVREKAREQHAGIRQVELLLPRLIEERSHLESAALSLVEQGGEHRRRVELREAHEVDRPVHPDEGDGVQIADDAVVLDRLVAHGRGPRAVCHRLSARGRPLLRAGDGSLPGEARSLSEYRGAPRVPRGATSAGGLGGPFEAPHVNSPPCPPAVITPRREARVASCQGVATCPMMAAPMPIDRPAACARCS